MGLCLSKFFWVKYSRLICLLILCLDLRKICDKIETVFENRKSTDFRVISTNCKMMHKIFCLLCCGEKIKSENQQSLYATGDISNHRTLPVHLVEIIVETEDLQTCIYTIDILYKLLTNSEANSTTIKKNLSFQPHFNQLLESMISIHKKFSDVSDYKEVLPDIHTKLLRMIVILYEVHKNKNILSDVTENTICFFGQLIQTYFKNKEFMINLLTVLKLLCFKNKNCELLTSKRFFDNLFYISKLTQKIVTIAQILKLLSRNATALNCMARNENIFNLLFAIANYNGKKTVKKRTLMSILYRLTRSVHGIKILKQPENFNKLLNYFSKNEKAEVFSNRMGTIKAYTILHRCVAKTVLPSSQLNMELHLPANILGYHDDVSLEESEKENDESDNEEDAQEVEELEYENDDCSDIELSDGEYLNTEKQLLSVEDVGVFFQELHKDDYRKFTKLFIYKDIITINPLWKNIIEDRVNRLKPTKIQAFPDAAMLETQTDEHYLNSATNDFSIESLIRKLNIAREMCSGYFNSRIIYNLDDLCGSACPVPDVPHPNTYVFTDDDINPQENSQNVLKFESRFESGNLRSVKQIDIFEYELLIKSDTNSFSGHQWFYFQVSNMIPGISYTLNIINFMKINSQFNYGMQPVLFSVKEYSLYGSGWKRCGEKIIYYGNNYTDENSIKEYRTLSFCIEFPYANDYVYLAYHYPYTYTRLMTMLFPIIIHNNSQEIYLRVDKLCNTVRTTNEVPLLTITGAWNHPGSLHIPFNERPVIFITARVHPGETNSSWIMEGMIKFLLQESDEQARRIRERFIFKIIPMLNPEGVICGNSRSGLTGEDLNRCWSNPNPITCPEIYYSKKLVQYVKDELKQPIAAYLDIHGHSRKKFFFFYGCNPLMSWNKKDKKSGDCLKILKILPEMVQVINPHVRLNFCKYKIQKKRESTARVVMWRQFGIQRSYTLECSYCSGDNNLTFNTNTLSDIGASVLKAVGLMSEQNMNEL